MITFKTKRGTSITMPREAAEGVVSVTFAGMTVEAPIRIDDVEGRSFPEIEALVESRAKSVLFVIVFALRYAAGDLTAEELAFVEQAAKLEVNR